MVFQLHNLIHLASPPHNIQIPGRIRMVRNLVSNSLAWGPTLLA